MRSISIVVEGIGGSRTGFKLPWWWRASQNCLIREYLTCAFFALLRADFIIVEMNLLTGGGTTESPLVDD